jgi:hypothetical protein
MTGQTTCVTGPTGPNGVVTPDMQGQYYINVDGQDVWFAMDGTNSGWVKIY